MLLTQQLAATATKNLARPAFRYLGKETSYNDLRTAVARLSYLYQREIGQNARVAFYTRNAPAVLTTFFALTNIRGTMIPLDPELPPEELLPWLKESKATHLAVTSDLTQKARELLQAGRLNLPIIEIEKKQGGEYDTSFTAAPEYQPVETDTILLLRTAGLTGKPRLVAFNHKQLQHAALCLRSPYHLLPTDRIYTKLSWSHPFAFVHGLLMPLLLGSTIVIDHGLEAAELLAFLREARATRLLGTPTFFQKLLTVLKTEEKPLVGVKSLTVAAGTLPAEAVQSLEKMSLKVAHCYGLTENLWTVSMEDTSPDPEAPKDFAGAQKPLAGLKYKVLDSNLDQIEGPDSRVGQLAVMGPTVMSGYRGLNPDIEKETKSAIRGTWLYTGDIARLEGDGEELRITFLGRMQDLAQLEGEWIPMSELHPVICSVPGVEDAAAFVTKTSRGDTVVLAAVVKAKGSTVNDKQVLGYCAQRLFGDQCPKGVVFTDAIPRDMGGNPNYTKLRLQFAGAAG